MKKFMEIKAILSMSIRMFLHDALFLICMAMSVGMFIQFGNSWWTMIIMGIVAAVFESTKLYDLLKAKKAYAEKNTVAVATNGFSYLVKAILSVVASVGFALVLLASQQSVAEVSEDTIVLEVDSFDENIEYWKSEMDRVTGEISALTEAINRASGNYGTSITKISSNKPALEASLALAQENWQKAKQEKVDYQKSLQSGEKKIATNPADMFNELTTFINAIRGTEELTSQTLMTMLFIAIMVILEISVATTSGNLPEIKEERKVEEVVEVLSAKEEIGSYYMNFIDAMFEGVTPGDRVNSINKIADITGYSSATVWKIRQSILTMSYKDKRILISKSGGTRAGMNKENMKKVVNFLLENPTDDILIPELP